MSLGKNTQFVRFKIDSSVQIVNFALSPSIASHFESLTDLKQADITTSRYSYPALMLARTTRALR